MAGGAACPRAKGCQGKGPSAVGMRHAEEDRGPRTGWGVPAASVPLPPEGGGALPPATKHLLVFPSDEVRLKGTGATEERL